jgi:hypothetical protein
MKRVVKFLAHNQRRAYLITFPLAFLLTLMVAKYLELGEMSIPFQRANTSVLVDQSDTVAIVDRFLEQDRDEFGVNTSRPSLSYENLNVPSVDTIKSVLPNSNLSYDASKERLINQQILAEQEAMLYPSPTKSYSRISEEELISKHERSTLGDSRLSDIRELSALDKEEKPQFNTIILKSRYTKDSETNNPGSEVRVKARIYSAQTQRLVHGSKAVFRLKDSVGILQKGDIIYGRVLYNSGSFQIEFNGKQFGLKQKLFLYSENERGIYVSTPNEEIQKELTSEGRNQVGQIAGDLLRSIPVVGQGGSRVLTRLSQSGGTRDPEIELMRGEVFSLEYEN